MICSKCGNQIPDGSQFCPYCNCPVSIDNSLQGQNVVQSQVVQQYGQSNNQYVVNNSKKSSSKYIFIIILLLTIIGLLGYIIIFNGNKELDNDKKEVDSSGNVSRTIMIYMSPSNLEYSSGIATADLEAIDGNKVDLDNINVLVYTGGTKNWKNDYIKNTENAIFKLTEDGFEKIETYDKLNLGDPKTLQKFLDYGYSNYKTDEYDLILYDHGNATQGAIVDDFKDDMLSLAEFEKALNDSEFSSDNKLEIVLFRTCLNSTIEVASVFDDYADYLVASEEITWGSGLTDVLSFLNNIKYEDDAITFGKKFIDSYDEQMDTISYFNGYELGSTYSITDLSKVNEIIDELGNFVKGIDLDKDYAKVARVRGNLFQFASDSTNEIDTVDLYNLIKGLSNYSDYDGDKLLDLINEAVVYNWSNLGTNGLSIYFPYKGSVLTKTQLINVYDEIDFNSNYHSFIKEFNKKKTTSSSKAFDSMLVDTEIKTNSDGYEASLKLNDDQINTYSDSIYIVFAKSKDREGKYQPIYSSDNTILDEDGTLHTDIGNHCIVATDEDGEVTFVNVYDRNINGRVVTRGFGVVNNWNIADVSDWETKAVTLYFDTSSDDVKVGAIASLGDDENPEGTVLDLKNYGILDITISDYYITDSSGNYNDNWEGDGSVYMFEISLDENTHDLNGEGVFKKVKLEDQDYEYYVLFKVFDVYGNSTYSELMKLEN